MPNALNRFNDIIINCWHSLLMWYNAKNFETVTNEKYSKKHLLTAIIPKLPLVSTIITLGVTRMLTEGHEVSNSRNASFNFDGRIITFAQIWPGSKSKSKSWKKFFSHLNPKFLIWWTIKQVASNTETTCNEAMNQMAPTASTSYVSTETFDTIPDFAIITCNFWPCPG